MKYATISAYWGDQLLIMHNCTKQEVLERAKMFGYQEPKWWQVWKTPIFYLLGEGL